MSAMVNSTVRGGTATRRYPSRPRADSRRSPSGAAKARWHYDFRRRDPRSANTQRSLPETSEFRSYITRSATDSTAARLRCCAAKGRVAPVLDLSLPGARVCRLRDGSALAVSRLPRSTRTIRSGDHPIFASDLRFRPGRPTVGRGATERSFRKNVTKCPQAAHSRIFASQPSADRPNVESHTRTVQKSTDACYTKVHVMAAIRARPFSPVAITERSVATTLHGPAGSRVGSHRTRRRPATFADCFLATPG